MAYSNTGGDLTDQGYQLGIFLVKAHYTVRGRRSVPLTIQQQVLRMSSSDKLEFLKALQATADFVFKPDVVKDKILSNTLSDAELLD
jgi:hypothetical protein